MQERMGIVWKASFVCEEKPGFLIRESPAVIDGLAKTPLWSELQVQGAWSDEDERVEPMGPPGTIASIKKLVKSGESVFLAHGDGDALNDRNRVELRLEISPGNTGIALAAIVRGEVLARIGVAALDAYADMLADLAVRWRPSGVRMTEALAYPTRQPSPFAYPQVRPPRVTRPSRFSHAVVDVLDAKIPDSARHPETAIATRALAIAAVPEGVTRRERDGVVILRWLDDPCDAEAAAKAAAAHQQWLYSLLPSSVAPDWNEAGDLKLVEVVQRSPPGLDLLTSNRGDHSLWFGHVAADKVIPPPPRALPDGKPLNELRLIAPSRDAALSMGASARGAGYDRVVYRDEKGEVWDPAPPGLWTS